MSELEMTLQSIDSNLQDLSAEDSSQIEILMSDNASTDSSFSSMEDFTKRRENSRCYLQQTDLGFRRNLEFLAKAATGDYILFMGAGAKLGRNLDLIKLLAGLSSTNDCQVFYRSEVFDEETDTILTTHPFDQECKPIFSTAPFPIWPREHLLRVFMEEKNSISGNWWPQVEWSLALFSRVRNDYSDVVLISGFRPKTSWATRESAIDAIHSLIRTLQNFNQTSATANCYVEQELRANIKSLPRWYFYLRVRRKVKGLWRKYKDSRSFFSNDLMTGFQTFIVLFTPVLILKVYVMVHKAVGKLLKLVKNMA